MADPNAIADIFEVIVNFEPALSPGRFAFSNPTHIAEFAANASFPGRVKAYTGTVSQKLAEVVNDGFATTSDTYRQVQMSGLQDGPPRTVYVGRKDPGEAWDVGVLAVKAAADLAGLSFYAFTTSTRDVTDIEFIADALEGDPEAPVFAFYLAQTKDANILADNPGNLARNILAKNYQRIALLWHDPEQASKFGPAVLRSIAGPFNIPNGATLDLRVNGGATQSYTFNAFAAALTGSVVETFAVTNGDTLLISTNNSGTVQTITASALAATVLSGAAETYNLVNGDTLLVRNEGGAVQVVTFNGTAGAVSTAGGDPFALNDGETVTFAIDGGGNQVVTFNAADFVDINNATAEELTAVYTAQLTGVTVTDDSSNTTVTSNRIGAASDVEIVAGTGTALANLGYSVGNNLGTGGTTSIPFLDSTTAAQAAAEINADTTGVTAADDSGSVRVTSDLVGTTSRVQITGGTANAQFQFNTNEFAGSGDFQDASVATAAEFVILLNNNLLGALASVGTGPDAGKVVLTSTQLGTGSQIDVDASALATTLGFATAPVDGTGDFFNAAQAQPSEIATVISVDGLTDAVVSSASNRVVITSNASGLSATVEASGGTLLNVLRFSDATTGIANLATGIGVQEDFADAGWMGFCITFDLDAASPQFGGAGGQGDWDDVTLKGPSPTGVGSVSLPGDTNLEAFRPLLHDTLRVNTYELRNGRNETHFGFLLNDQLGAGGYIDVRTTMDWLKARLSEKFKEIRDSAAAAKSKYPYAPSGIAVFDQGMREVLNRAQTNGHTFYDSSPLDLNNPLDRGIFTPTIAGQTQVDINNRKINNFQARQLIQGSIQRGRVVVTLVGPVSEIAA